MTDVSNANADLCRFYKLVSRLEFFPNQGLRLNEYNGKAGLPFRGVYFFQENGELRSSEPSVARIVRVGTHGVSQGSKATLWGRLKTHLGSRAGGGNHRGSIFRLHVGAAMLARDGNLIPSWGVGSSTPQIVRACAIAKAAEADWEQKVSKYIGAMSVFWVDVGDEPSPDSKRSVIERNAIALLSHRLTPIDSPSSSWLGNYSPREQICRSGLWNLNYVGETYTPSFLDDLETAIEQMGKAGSQ